MQTLSLEVAGWRGLRRRSDMGNCLPWVLIATTQVEATDAAHFQYDPTETENPMLSCFLLQVGIWIIHQQHSPSGLVTQTWSKSFTWSTPSSSLFIKNWFRQAKNTDLSLTPYIMTLKGFLPLRLTAEVQHRASLKDGSALPLEELLSKVIKRLTERGLES